MLSLLTSFIGQLECCSDKAYPCSTEAYYVTAVMPRGKLKTRAAPKMSVKRNRLMRLVTLDHIELHDTDGSSDGYVGATKRNNARDRKNGDHVDPVSAPALLKSLIMLSVKSFYFWLPSAGPLHIMSHHRAAFWRRISSSYCECMLPDVDRRWVQSLSDT